MLKIFYPNEQEDSVYDIQFSQLYEDGIRGMIFDIDNTLVPHGFEADDKIIKLLKDLMKSGMQVCLLSNNKEPRVSSFANKVDVPYIFNARKPFIRSYQRAMSIMGTNVSNTVVVGDQIFTDIYGANRVGMHSILVKPIHPREEIQIVLKRYLESIILYFYKRQCDKRKMT